MQQRISILRCVLFFGVALAGPAAGSVASAGDTVVLVSDAYRAGWEFANYRLPVIGTLVDGPAEPPLGAGSARIAFDSTGWGRWQTRNHRGKLNTIAEMSYWMFNAGDGKAHSIVLGLIATSPTGTVFLEFRPHATPDSIVPRMWQEWRPIEGTWWSFSTAGKACRYGCTWQEVQKHYGNFNLSFIYFRAGGYGEPAAGYDGYFDAFTLTIGSTTTTYDFETAPTATFSGARPAFAAGPLTTCEAGDFESLNTHYWKLRAGGSGIRTVTLRIGTMARPEPDPDLEQTVFVTIRDLYAARTAQAVMDDAETFTDFPIVVQSGETYDFSVAVSGLRHYRIGTAEDDVELGIAMAFDALGPRESNWLFNVEPGEWNVEVLGDSRSVPATSVTYAVAALDRPNPVPLTAAELGPDAPIRISGVANKPETLIFHVAANGHLRLRKVDGADRGLYPLTCGLNLPPVAVCRDVSAVAGPGCTAPANIDAGSSDRDTLEPVRLVQSPAGPFTIGTTMARLTATDNLGASDSCTARVRVVDTVPPEIACVPGANPAGHTPAAQNQDGFFRIVASSRCTPAASLQISLGSHRLDAGETIKITQVRGGSGVRLVNAMGREPVRHFQVGGGPAVVTVTDASGQTASATCQMSKAR